LPRVPGERSETRDPVLFMGSSVLPLGPGSRASGARPGHGRRELCHDARSEHGSVAMVRLSFVLAILVALSSTAPAQPVPPPADNKPDATLRSTPETVVWGYFAADIPPALRIKSGQTVRIDTVSHGGVNTGVDPVTFFGRHGVAANEVLKDAIEIYEKVNRPSGASAHILTGPIYVEEAEPGDMLEVRILALDYRVPYAVNNTNR